jgi:hypothetical protein
MSAKKYKRTLGKLRSSIAIPVDEEMKRIETQAKQKKFEFNQWARDILYSRIHEVVEECQIEGLKDAV